MSERPRLRILCFGNPLHGDDGFGPAVALALRSQSLPAGVEVIECGTRGLDALHFFEDCPAIVLIDAMAGNSPGTLHHLTPDRIPPEATASLGHGAGLGYLLAAARETLAVQPRIDIMAAEMGRSAPFAEGLSLPVAAAVGKVPAMLHQLHAALFQSGDHDLGDELEILREANRALEMELTRSTESLEELIGEQERQQDELQNRSRELARLNSAIERAINTMSECLVVLDGNGRVTRVNRRLENELGQPAQRLIGQFIEDFLPDSQRNLLLARLPLSQRQPPLLLNAIRASNGRFEVELQVGRDGDGASKPFLVHASLLHSPAGKLEGAVIAATDIGILKAREQALRENRQELQKTASELKAHRDNLAHMVEMQTADLRQAKEAAETANRVKTDFLSNTSHEIRTPLNAIIGMAELCLLTPLNERQNNYLAKIKSAADHLQGIVNDILDYSKIEAGKLSMEWTPFDLAALLDEVTDLLINRIEAKGLTLIVDLAPEAMRRFIGDPMRLKQILINLLSNAVKFSEHGDLHLKVRPDSSHHGLAGLRFTIRDQGIGISPEQQATLFSPFTQADTSTTRRYGGTGLGLVIAKRLVEYMNGEIGLQSVPGQGSTFHFTVQLGQTDEARIDTELGEQLARHAGRHVLIADDNPLIRDTLSGQCRALGLLADAYPGGEAALAAATRPDAPHYLLALIDHQMPGGMSGLETIASLHERLGQRAPASLLLTPHGFNQSDGVLPADALLAKPCSIHRLFAAIASLLALPSHAPASQPVPRLNIHSAGLTQGAEALVVDDVEMNLELMQDLLTSAGLRVRLAENGQAAIEAIEQQRPDVVLMDIQMPVMDGLEATRRLRARPEYRDLPIIAITAGGLKHDRAQCLEAGMNGHMTKPVDLEALLRLIGELLPRHPAPAAPSPPPLATPASPLPTAPPQPATDERLPELPGIDVSAGLAVVRNKLPFYRRMLQKFRESYGTAFMEEFKQTLDSGDIAAATRLAHTLKGVSRNLGIMTLGDLAAAVEAELKDPAGPRPPHGLPPLQAELNRLQEMLANLG